MRRQDNGTGGILAGALAGMVGGLFAAMAMDGFHSAFQSVAKAVGKKEPEGGPGDGERGPGDGEGGPGDGEGGCGQPGGGEGERAGGEGGPRSDRAEQSRRAEQSGGAGEEEPATVRAAEAISRTVRDRGLGPAEKELAGPAVHYGYSILWGGIYGAAAERLPAVATGLGLPFGIGLWLFGDELGLAAVGLAKWPTEYPASTHARALGAHLTYGLVTDLVRRGVRWVER